MAESRRSIKRGDERGMVGKIEEESADMADEDGESGDAAGHVQMDGSAFGEARFSGAG